MSHKEVVKVLSDQSGNSGEFASLCAANSTPNANCGPIQNLTLSQAYATITELEQLQFFDRRASELRLNLLGCKMAEIVPYVILNAQVSDFANMAHSHPMLEPNSDDPQTCLLTTYLTSLPQEEIDKLTALNLSGVVELIEIAKERPHLFVQPATRDLDLSNLFEDLEQKMSDPRAPEFHRAKFGALLAILQIDNGPLSKLALDLATNYGINPDAIDPIQLGNILDRQRGQPIVANLITVLTPYLPLANSCAELARVILPSASGLSPIEHTFRKSTGLALLEALYGSSISSDEVQMIADLLEVNQADILGVHSLATDLKEYVSGQFRVSPRPVDSFEDVTRDELDRRQTLAVREWTRLIPLTNVEGLRDYIRQEFERSGQVQLDNYTLKRDIPAGLMSNFSHYGASLLSKRAEVLKLHRWNRDFDRTNLENSLLKMCSLPDLVCAAIEQVNFPARELYFIVAAFSTKQLTPKFISHLAILFGPKAERLSDEGLDLFSELVRSGGVARRIAGTLIQNFTQLNREDINRLTTLAGMADVLKHEPLVLNLIISQLKNQAGLPFGQVYASCIEVITGVLKSEYPSFSLASRNLDDIIRQFRVYSVFERFLIKHKRNERIPILRAIQLSELRGTEEKLRCDDKEELKDLRVVLTRNLEDSEDRQAAFEYIERRLKDHTNELQTIFGDYTGQSRKQLLELWHDTGHQYSQIVTQVVVEDVIRDVRNSLDNMFCNGHIGEVFAKSEFVGPTLDPNKELAEQWRQVKAQLTSAEQSDSSNVDYLHSRLKEIELNQVRLKPWEPLRKLARTYQERLDSLSAEYDQIRTDLAENGAAIETLGFNSTDSFHPVSFRGDLHCLKQALDSLSSTERSKSEFTKVRALIDQANLVNTRTRMLLKELGTNVQKILLLMEETEAKVGALVTKISPEYSWNAAIDAVAESFPNLATYLFGSIPPGQPDPNVDTVIDALKAYRNDAALSDIRDIIRALAEGEQDSAPEVYIYQMEHKFSSILTALVGQCLDYRPEKNNIGNSTHNLAFMEPNRQLIVAYDQNRVARVNGAISIAAVSVENGKFKPAVVADSVYTSDYSVMTAEKRNGYLRFAFERAQRLGLALIVPKRLLNYAVETETEDGSTKTQSAKIKISIGASGSVYSEIVAFRAYTQSTEVELDCYVLRPEQDSAIDRLCAI